MLGDKQRWAHFLRWGCPFLWPKAVCRHHPRKSTAIRSKSGPCCLSDFRNSPLQLSAYRHQNANFYGSNCNNTGELAWGRTEPAPAKAGDSGTLRSNRPDLALLNPVNFPKFPSNHSVSLPARGERGLPVLCSADATASLLSSGRSKETEAFAAARRMRHHVFPQGESLCPRRSPLSRSFGSSVNSTSITSLAR